MLQKFYKYVLLFAWLILQAGCSTFYSASKHPIVLHPSKPIDPKGASNYQSDDIAIAASKLIGVPYRWGGNTPASGFDCSGLVYYVFAQSRQIYLPRTTSEMSKFGQNIPKSALTPGDLVFFNTLGDPYSHVGIYTGKGKFVHAPTSGGTVRQEDLSANYWSSRFTEARRMSTN